MPSLKIFLDASVVLSGLASFTGGSRKILEAAKDNKIKLLTTPLIIQEVINHLQKLDIETSQLETLLSRKTIQLMANPSKEIIEKFSKTVPDPNDAHVLAGASLSGAIALISLDKKHLLTLKVRKILKPMLVKSPKEF
ncbi:putative toxin-antitoxin system toxin component, PIN family [Candidatus Gottesmanbacteria bacterium]|nr:putative toxin-antitoxin system toxin component, PIN family [Candidatus Gottesmanbacteria bacterium]